MKDAPDVAQYVHARPFGMSVITGDDEEAKGFEVTPKRHRVESHEQGYLLVLHLATEEIAKQREQVGRHVLECPFLFQLRCYVLACARVLDARPPL